MLYGLRCHYDKGWTLLAAFAGIALILATISIYDAVAYTVAEHTGEIGVRMALRRKRRSPPYLLVISRPQNHTPQSGAGFVRRLATANRDQNAQMFWLPRSAHQRIYPCTPNLLQRSAITSDMAALTTTPQLKLVVFAAENYKCLQNVTVPLVSSLAVLVGRNNTGKSTLLDVFDFILEASVDPNAAIQRRGAVVRDLQWRFLENAYCRLTLDFNVPDPLRNQALKWLESQKGEGIVTRLQPGDVNASRFLHTLRYEVCFGGVFHEQISTNNPAEGDITFPLAFLGGKQGLNPHALNLNSLWNYDLDAGMDQYFISRHSGSSSIGALPRLLFHQHEQTPAQFAINWVRGFFAANYHSSPHRKSEDSQQIKSVTAIAPDGANLVQVLHTLHNNEKPTFQKIERDLCRLVDGVESLSTPIDTNSTTTLLYQDFGDAGPLPVPIKQVSAGTIQLLILLTQLHTRPDNSLILLEEIENMLHPRAQAEFARILRENAERLTIIMSTHSPVIASETREDSLYLVKKVQGATELQAFTDEIADELVDEMGIRASYNFESNTVIFVEGKFDERAFEVWLQQKGLTASIIDSGGYSNVQFYANAKILQRRAVRVEKFAVFDGDTRKKGDAKQAIKLLNLDADHVLELDEDNLEVILAQARAIVVAFPALKQPQPEIERLLAGVAPSDLKGALGSILRTVGGYTVENAGLLAAQIDPPAKWLAFFAKVDAQEQKLG